MADELVVAISRHLGVLLENPAHAERAEQLEVARECLCDAFDIDLDTAGPASCALAQAWAAKDSAPPPAVVGPAAEGELSHELSDAFAKFVVDVSNKGFFKGCTVGSAAFNERFAKAKQKFFSKYAPTEVPAPAIPEAAPSSEELKQSAEERKLQGNTALRAGDLEGALRAYGEAIELDPSNPIYFSNRAAVYTRRGDEESLKQAISDCEHAIEIDPTYVKGYTRLGLALFHQGKYQEAIDRGYQKAVDLDPHNPQLQKDLRNCQGNLPGAAAAAAAASPPNGMPDMGQLAGLMQNPAVMQMAEQMMGGGGGGGGGIDLPAMMAAMQNPAGGSPDFSAMMAAMGGGGMPSAGAMGTTGAGAGGGGASPSGGEAAATETAQTDGAELYEEEEEKEEDGGGDAGSAEAGGGAESVGAAGGGAATGAAALSSVSEAGLGSSDDGASGSAGGASDQPSNPMEQFEQKMQQKMQQNPRLAKIMEEVQTNPMAILQHMGDPEVQEMVQGMMGGMFGGGAGGDNPLAAMMAGMGGQQ